MSQRSPDQTGTTVFRLLSDPANPEAWQAFVHRYGPRIHAWCRGWRLQEADAEEVTQAVLARLLERINTYRPSKGSFRGWLKTVTHHAWADYLESRLRAGAGRGGSSIQEQLEAIPAEDLGRELEEQELREARLALLKQALARVKERAQPRTLEVFEQLVYEKRSPEEVAAEFGMRVSAVYVARNRVQTMLREEVEKLQQLSQR
jgi:RNA polymerase sigma-70 factor (ECF subfamily)